MTREERVRVINDQVRALFEMPAHPTPIRQNICLHCVLSGSGKRRHELCQKLAAILTDNGVNPKYVVESARSKGVTNFFFDDGKIVAPTEVERHFSGRLEPAWHRCLSFDLLMQIAQEVAPSS